MPLRAMNKREKKALPRGDTLQLDAMNTDPLPGIAQQLGCPLLLPDHQITRRQRIHVLYLPSSRYPLSDVNLVNLLRSDEVRTAENLALLIHIDSSDLVLLHLPAGTALRHPYRGP